MSTEDVPPLTPEVWESIKVAAYRVQQKYADLLKPYSINSPATLSHFLGTDDSDGLPAPPKQPIAVGKILGNYAKALFDIEAFRYPESIHFHGWLKALAARVESVVISHAKQVGLPGAIGAALALRRQGISYHITDDQMAEAIRAALWPKLEVIRISDPQVYGHGSAQTAPPQPDISRKPPESIGRQIRQLRDETRITIDDLANEVGLTSKTVQRHESDKSGIRPKNLKSYEEVFSRHLSRKIVLPLSS